MAIGAGMNGIQCQDDSSNFLDATIITLIFISRVTVVALATWTTATVQTRVTLQFHQGGKVSDTLSV